MLLLVWIIYVLSTSGVESILYLSPNVRTARTLTSTPRTANSIGTANGEVVSTPPPILFRQRVGIPQVSTRTTRIMFKNAMWRLWFLPRLLVLPQLRKSTMEIKLCPSNGFGPRRGFFFFSFCLFLERRFIDHHIFFQKKTFKLSSFWNSPLTASIPTPG